MKGIIRTIRPNYTASVARQLIGPLPSCWDNIMVSRVNRKLVGRAKKQSQSQTQKSLFHFMIENDIFLYIKWGYFWKFLPQKPYFGLLWCTKSSEMTRKWQNIQILESSPTLYKKISHFTSWNAIKNFGFVTVFWLDCAPWGEFFSGVRFEMHSAFWKAQVLNLLFGGQIPDFWIRVSKAHH